MDFRQTPFSNCEVRNIIKYLTAKNKSGAEIHCQLCVMYSEEQVINVRNVQWWQKILKEGRRSTHDAEQESRPHSEIDEMTPCAHVLLVEKHCLTITNLC